ncbi:hypothetical protein [Streptomyces violascens]|uniref:hypothetical protein n=1 Tax=Streptomyces violascens TaxID=67381 RepID=UPI001679275E|nr:hypothetical protein [Streptomyces violascens]
MSDRPWPTTAHWLDNAAGQHIADVLSRGHQASNSWSSTTKTYTTRSLRRSEK